MLTKIKNFWVAFGALIVGAFAFMAYFLTRKNETIKALKTKVAVAQTEKQSDLIEAEINELKSDKKLNQKANKELDKTLEKLNEKKALIKDVQTNLTPEEAAEYWNKS